MSCVTTLKKRGLKLTPQRLLIADIIHDAKGHLTAGEIIGHVQAKMPGVNKTTIYRTLDILEEAGCVYKSELGNEFIYHHDDEGHHHHMMCRRCGKTIECSEDTFAPLQKSLMNKYGFRVDFKHVVMSGLCKQCKKKSN
jgi:Fur family transcriptional regulator, ferric uptake regulator